MCIRSFTLSAVLSLLLFDFCSLQAHDPYSSSNFFHMHFDRQMSVVFDFICHCKNLLKIINKNNLNNNITVIFLLQSKSVAMSHSENTGLMREKCAGKHCVTLGNYLGNARKLFAAVFYCTIWREGSYAQCTFLQFEGLKVMKIETRRFHTDCIICARVQPSTPKMQVHLDPMITQWHIGHRHAATPYC